MDPDASLAAPRRRALRSPGPLVIALVLGALVLVTAAITPWSSVRRAPQPGTVAAPGGNAENVVAASSAAATSRRFVTGISGNQRYFVDQTGRAILVRGDSPWAMMTDLSPRQARHYLDNRKKYGVNALIVSLVGAEANGGPSDDGATFDGIRPFARNDITRPNKTYWSRVESYVAMARKRGITLFLYPMDGWNTGDGKVFDNPSLADCAEYGRKLGARFSDYPNIVWMVGGDYYSITDEPVRGSNVDHQFAAMLKGIRGSDSRLRSIQLSPRKSISSDNPYWKKRVDWNFVYTYYVTYKAVGEAYERRNPVMPALFGEGSYENGGLDMNAGPDVIRRQAAWALTSGSPGEFTGQEGVWDFQQGWKKKLDTRSAVQLKSVRDLFESLKGWSRLVPDTGHAFVTSGRGRRITTDAAVWPKSSDYVTAARSRRGSLAVIYVPSARTITVDMARMRSGPSATWVDPTNGTRRRTKPDGTFRTPGRNAAGAGDWLLVLRA